MRTVLRSIAAVVAGSIVASIVMMIIETINCTGHFDDDCSGLDSL